MSGFELSRKQFGLLTYLERTGKKKSLDWLEKVVKGQIKEIRAEGENFVKPKTGEWIPVTERLPENGGRYLVNYSSGYVTMTYYYEFAATWAPTTTERIVAWMPLPEPYKEDKE